MQMGCEGRDGRELSEGKEGEKCVISPEKRRLLFFIFAGAALVMRSTKVTPGTPIY